jgi:hypothetical protein
VRPYSEATTERIEHLKRETLEGYNMAKLVRAEEMATMLEVHVDAIEMLVQNGMPEEAKGKFDPAVAVPWYLAYMRTKIFGKAKKLGFPLR